MNINNNFNSLKKSNPNIKKDKMTYGSYVDTNSTTESESNNNIVNNSNCNQNIKIIENDILAQDCIENQILENKENNPFNTKEKNMI